MVGSQWQLTCYHLKTLTSRTSICSAVINTPAWLSSCLHVTPLPGFLLKVPWLWYVAFLSYTCSGSPGARSKHGNPLIVRFKQDPPRLIWKDTFLSFLPAINNYEPNVWRCRWIMGRTQQEQRSKKVNIYFSFVANDQINILCMQPNIFFPIDLLPIYRIQYLGSG